LFTVLWKNFKIDRKSGIPNLQHSRRIITTNNTNIKMRGRMVWEMIQCSDFTALLPLSVCDRYCISEFCVQILLWLFFLRFEVHMVIVSGFASK
jgi:hypothetical protein